MCFYSLPSVSLHQSFKGIICSRVMAERGQPLPKFGEWDVNDPASAEGFTFIFNKAKNERKGGAKPNSSDKDNRKCKNTVVLGKPQSKRWFCCLKAAHAE